MTRMKGTKVEGPVVISITSEGKVIELEDMVLQGGIDIAR